ncbi:hypothetical protein HG535_0D01320 [Zygotorulaspora mrakii]|uniref:Binder of USO1 and GRH1 protein 1 n=1 Tax=Zygotorulaspora mrakii TaxID=42260 RepID=A0A7H9B211_ZYGMR|nr:uncharacterized protein HG535_0D01320 [Zygotorulaspora mrakii]QLG72424.1 hypothetical protein HG535_0D01320 [Zygotorulaspora mrakii]
MTDQDEEVKRIKQLEDARKRVEELKKKSKKNKDKKNRDKKNAQQNQESKSSEHEGSVDAPEQTEDVFERDEAAKDSSVQLTEGELSSDQGQEATPGFGEARTQEHAHKSGPETKKRTEDEQKEETGSEAEKIPSSTEQSENNEDSQGEQEVHEAKTEVKSSDSSNPPLQNDTHALFDEGQGNETDFMATIQKEKDQNELENLKEQLETVIKENKTMKFINMDHETEIEELQNEIELLNKELDTARRELASVRLQLDTKESEIRSLGQQQQQTDSVDFGVSNSLRQTASNGPQVIVDRASLDKWRNWNVDMTTWRSIGSGAIVEF